jgi:hypothetical protein
VELTTPLYVLATTPERVTVAAALDDANVNVPVMLEFALTAVMVPLLLDIVRVVNATDPLTVEAIKLLPLNLVRAAVALISVLSSLISSTIWVR